MPTTSPNAQADKRPWIEIELLRWFDDAKPIRATDNRPAENRQPAGEPATAGVTPLEPPEFRRPS